MSTRPANLFAAFGFSSAVIATILGTALAPRHPVSTINLLERAVSYVLIVFGVAGITAYIGFLIRREGDRDRAQQVAVRTGATCVWMPPLLMFYFQGSWLALVVWAVFVVEAARLVAYLGETPSTDAPAAHSFAEEPSFSVLKRDFPAGVSMCGTFLIQGALFAIIGGYFILAGILYFFGTAAIACRSMRMFRDLAAPTGWPTRRIQAVLVVVTSLIVFAWLPYIHLSGGSDGGGNFPAGGGRIGSLPGSQGNRGHAGPQVHQGTAGMLVWLKNLLAPGRKGTGNSFAVAKHLLDSTVSEPTVKPGSGFRSLQKTKIAAAFVVTGPAFPGVELYPEAASHPKLVAPPLPGTKGFGTTRSNPLSIPFDGVYWFWHGPTEQPPSNSVVMYGTPSAQFFRTISGDGISMEARQNLGFVVDPSLYSAIEIVLENADPFPNTVSLALRIRNTTEPGRSFPSLGIERVVIPNGSPATGVPAIQTLTFRIPNSAAIGRFDELMVSYYLKGPRTDRSARIAIERFRLVPRGR